MPRWKIEKIVPGGAGFARQPDGRAAFAAGALPGETIDVQEADEHRGYAVARSFRVLTASADRVEPPCPVARACGGCDFMHATYDAQLRHKLAMLREALERTGGFASLPPLSMACAAEPVRYRNRVRLHVDEDGRIGFFARHSRSLVAITSCLVAEAPVDSAIERVRAIAARHGRALGACKAIEIRSAPAGCPLLLHLLLRRASERPPGELLSALAREFSLAISGEASPAEQRWPLPGEVEIEAPPGVFTQVNWQVNQQLVRAVVEGAASRGARSFCDLYAGAGNFTLPLLKAGLTGVAVEGMAPALEAAERAARRQGLAAGARFICDEVAAALRGSLRGQRFDLVVIDPPRSGAREIVPVLAAARPLAIAYCACDPVTLARDLAALAKRGFELESVRAFDMFPQTHHFEVLAWMRAPAAPA